MISVLDGGEKKLYLLKEGCTWSAKIKKVLVDGGYKGQNFADTIKELSNAEVEVVKRNELHTFAILPKRWIAERSFG